MLNTRPSLMKASFGSGDSTAANSNTSPVRISLVALSTVSGFIQLPEPRWSPAPHRDGQRCASGGICHKDPAAGGPGGTAGADCALMAPIVPARQAIATPPASVMNSHRLMSASGLGDDRFAVPTAWPA